MIHELQTLDALAQRSFMRFVISVVLGIKVPLIGKATMADISNLLIKAPEGRSFLTDPDKALDEGIRRSIRADRFKYLKHKVHRKMVAPPYALELVNSYCQLETGSSTVDEDGLKRKDVNDRIALRGSATTEDLRRIFGGSDRVWGTACRHGLIPGAEVIKRGPTGQQWRIPLSSVAVLSKFFRWSLSREETAARLRICPAQVPILSKLRVLMPVFGRRTFDQSKSVLCRYWIGAADNLLDLLGSLSQEQVPRDTSRLISLADPPGRYGYKWATLMRWVVSAEVPIYQVHPLKELGFRAFAVSLDDIRVRSTRWHPRISP